MLKSSTPFLQVPLCNQVFGAENRILRGLEIGGVRKVRLRAILAKSRAKRVSVWPRW
jgi:hypothetical protein